VHNLRLIGMRIQEQRFDQFSLVVLQHETSETWWILTV
jgi:hypothetical protein